MEREKHGSSHVTSGVCREGQTTGFLRAAGSQKRRKFFPGLERSTEGAMVAPGLRGADARSRTVQRNGLTAVREIPT